MQNSFIRGFAWFIIGSLSALIFVGCSSQFFPVESDFTPTQISSSNTVTPSVPKFTPTLIPLPTSTPIPTITPVGGSEKIVFKWVDTEDDGKIYLVNTDGSNIQTLANITVTTYGVGAPKWSPDGSKVAFASVSFSGFGIVYITDTEGSGVHEFTSTFASRFAWSNDGTKMAVLEHDNSFSPMQMSIFVVDVENGSSSRITDNDLDTNAPKPPIWSPDDSRILFQGRTVESGLYSQEYNLYIVNADGSDLRQLTDDEDMGGRSIAWSANGDKIFFDSKRNGDVEIYALNLNDGKIDQLTNNDAGEGGFHLSSDGTQIVFTSNRDGDWEIYVMDINGNNVRQLTDNNVDDSHPRWSPDGQQILFSSEIDTDTLGMFLVNVDGSNVHRFTDIEASHFFLYEWQPSKTK